MAVWRGHGIGRTRAAGGMRGRPVQAERWAHTQTRQVLRRAGRSWRGERPYVGQPCKQASSQGCNALTPHAHPAMAGQAGNGALLINVLHPRP